MAYKFNKEKHIHELDGKPLMGVTTVLSVISKPMLIQWAANMAVEYCEQNLGRLQDVKEWVDVFKEARVAHRKKKESAGDWGTNVHGAIENWIKNKMEPMLEETQQKAFYQFRKWATDNNVEFIESEKHVWSKEYWIGGIVDLVFMMDGKKYIGDIKTSSGIYNEAFFQMGAYNLCLDEMGEHKDVEGYIVINLKKDGTMDLKLAENMEINKQAFKHALGLHQIISSLK